ncbi:hypothetical protein KIN20_002011 [Parelaphostrongylus tenuis]|uniref:MADF domain-containing protein n=1 Tax=Parelaphostrongylus tenuis TaxID=148309 RepID=A0AAD5LX24_PARTN|nr:hypothetical protein KIN20_002011 [Parelaphostrongylus tenuis]
MEKTMMFFREIAAILSNQDKRMNEWAVLQKWCWMMEMFARAVERPSSFEWRFKGAMGFHLESVMNGVQYLDSLPHEILVQLTKIYAITEEEIVESKRELNRKFKKGSGMFQTHMVLYHKLYSFVDAARPRVGTKRSRGRRNSTTTIQETNKEGISDVSNTKNLIAGEPDSGEKAVKMHAEFDVPIKQEVLEDDESAKETPLEKPAATSMEPFFEGGNNAADDSPGESCQFPASDVVWSTPMICTLIQCVKDAPALWHHNHPDYRNSLKRKEHFGGIAAKLRTLPGGETVNEGHVSGKWSILRECFNKQLKKSKQGAVSSWEHYNRLLFLSPESMSLWKYEDSSGDKNQTTTTSTSSVNVPVTVKDKILEIMSEAVKLKDADDNSIKKARMSLEPNSIKISIQKDSMSNVQQVVSTWVPPREDSLDTSLRPHSATPPTATAQVTATSELAHILQRPSPHLTVNGTKVAYTDFVPDHNVRPHEDKWTLMGRMIEETARELEAKRSELAFRLQKEISDVIFKYQLESLKQK